MILLNIGLHTNTGKVLDLTTVNAALQRARVRVCKARIHQSPTEPTLVAELRDPPPIGTLFVLAEILLQDCIAYWDGERGHLIGPAPWGDFNPEFFMMLSGASLADTFAVIDAMKPQEAAQLQSLPRRKKPWEYESNEALNKAQLADIARQQGDAWSTPLEQEDRQ